MRVAVVQGTVESDEREELFEIGIDMRRVRELLEPFDDRSFVTAAVFLIGAFGIEHAKILKAAICTVNAKVETVDHQCACILGEREAGYVQPAFLGNLQAKILVRRQLRIFSWFPELHDMRSAPIALRQPCVFFMGGEGIFITDQHFGLDTADTRERGEAFDKVAEQVAASPSRQNLIDGLEWNILLQLLFLPREADATDLGAPHDGQQIKIIERTGGFCKRKSQSLAQHALRKIHLEDGGKTKTHVPGREAHR